MARKGNQMRAGARLLAKILRTIQGNWFYWLNVTGMRLAPTVFFFVSGKALYAFEVLPCPNSDRF
jgi:hypothetical protein